MIAMLAAEHQGGHHLATVDAAETRFRRWSITGVARFPAVRSLDRDIWTGLTRTSLGAGKSAP